MRHLILGLVFALCACNQQMAPDDIQVELMIEAQQTVINVHPLGVVPANLLANAQKYYNKHLAEIRNRDYIIVVDFAARSSKARFFLINVKTGAVETYRVAHGAGSDANNDGYAESFGNVHESYKSSLGFYTTDNTYKGGQGISLKLDGLSKTNSNVRDRLIVMHGAKYVTEENVVQGRSLGCLALSKKSYASVILRVQEGVLIYADLSTGPVVPE